MVAERIRRERICAHDRAHEGMADFRNRLRCHGVLPGRCTLSRSLIGNIVARVGPKGVMAAGALALAASVMGISHVQEPWQVYACFTLMGIGYAGLGATALSTTLAPWFERQQGRVVATVLMGASVGGMVGAAGHTARDRELRLPSSRCRRRKHCARRPVASHSAGSAPTTRGHRVASRWRSVSSLEAHREPTRWRTSDAVRTRAFVTVVVAFGVCACDAIGFLTHHVALIAPSLVRPGLPRQCRRPACAALAGRRLFSRYADRVELRLTSAVLADCRRCRVCHAGADGRTGGNRGSERRIGTTLGNITALSPIIVRREFGAIAFGPIYGTAAAAIGIVAAFGPATWGLLHDFSGGYAAPLLVSAALDLVAAIVVTSIRARRRAKKAKCPRWSHSSPGRAVPWSPFRHLIISSGSRSWCRRRRPQRR